MLGRCRIGTAGPASYPTGCYALAHPTTGIALVDVAPDATPNAESRLRRALGTANFWPAFPGYLPVWHGRIELSAWRALPGIMAEGFSELPPLTVPGKGAWIAAARAGLADDPAWEVPGAAARGARRMPAAALPPDIEPDLMPMERRPGRRAALALGFAATFALGLASGVAVLSGDRRPSAAPVAPAAGVAPLPAVQPVALTAPAQIPVQDLARPAPEPVPGTPLPKAVEAPPLVPQVVPEAVASTPPIALPPTASAREADGANPSDPVEAVSSELPLPPSAPKAPPLKTTSRPPERIDRVCSQALYRFQQGVPLTATETAYLRDGCATRR